MNLPNQLTVLRFVMTAVFLAVMFSRSPVNDTLALVFFSIASLTDYFDGKIARERKLITNFGILMDPLADKILTCSAFIALVERAQLAPAPIVIVEAWMAIVIVARELAITGLRLLAASKGVTLAAERYGKHKTISQMVAVIALLVLDAHVEWWPVLKGFFNPWVGPFAQFSLWVTVSLTATSGALYLYRNREIYLSDV
ncbi:MAG: CDP-diacylglycerol--glycerol-3-phosphate 3-phosphatidyltransferase [Verrucomicrobia bacterium]|nr:CDP-diacylglycerol--glycerol-3-phosphate 3-phosphatidyltransferase [Verrucomicrobiota bacterium]